jgi:pimeloyl-ACP methyl ester carboxylesterase
LKHPDQPANPPVIVVPGTFWKDVESWAVTYSPAHKPMQAIAKIFGAAPTVFDWSGANSSSERHAAAERLAQFIRSMDAPLVHLLGFSHGGNVASEAASILVERVDLLVTIATPVTGNYKTGGARRHINLYSPEDRMQILGGEGPLGLPAFAGREFPGSTNVAIPNIPSADVTGSHGNILWSDEAWRILETLH